MFFERIESEGLAHYSYLIGHGGEAIVIDPRRDCDIYLEKAVQNGLRIAHILETHRNEDYVVGSVELACRTGAEMWHADEQLDYQYGRAARAGQKWEIGRLLFEAIDTPGHTPGSMSYLLYDPDGNLNAVFSGDVLFAGAVGRVDLMGADRMESMASMLYDSLFKKLLPLGDGVIVCPAHGSGSVCGSAISERMWTTIGIERQLNPKLQFGDRTEFIANVAQELDPPPYFKRMERWNIQGPPILGPLPVPLVLAPEAFATEAKDAVILDTRSELAFGAAHVPGSLSIWLSGVSSFAGWFVTEDLPLLLVTDPNELETTVRYLIRLGFDKQLGFLSGGMLSWHETGRESQALGMITVQDMCHRLDSGERCWILDVRSEGELERSGRIPAAHHIHITQLPQRIDEVPHDREIYIFCGSGLRSTVAASLLQQNGWENLNVVLGGFSGWTSTTCPVEM